MLLFIIISVSIVIFPIFLNGYLFFKTDDKKAYFSIYIFKIFRILGGYMEIIQDGLVIHLSKTKAIILPITSFADMGKKVKPLKDYHIMSFRTRTEIGIENNTLTPLSVAFCVNILDAFLNWLFSNNKPYLEIDNRTDVYENKNIFNIYAEITIVLNLLMIILSFIKIITEKIIYAISNRKQQNI